MVQMVMRRMLSPACSPPTALEVTLQLLLSPCTILLDDAGGSAVAARLSAGRANCLLFASLLGVTCHAR
jgi:hypothetical protein